MIYSVAQGEDVSLECVAAGHPEPLFKWYSGGEVLESGGKISITENVIGSGKVNGTLKRTTLNIQSISRNDYGVFVCKANNSIASESLNITLTGLGKLL